MSISVVINSLNEAEYLHRALSSVKNFADEIVVVDMNSDDDTAKIAKKAGAKVFKHKRINYVEPARNYAISKATGDWIFVLDPDEKLPKTLTTKLNEIMKDPEADYYRVPRKNVVFGKWMEHSRWWPDYNIRFFRKDFVDWSEEIHSVPVTTGKGADLPVEEEMAIIHFNYTSVDQYLNRLMRYTTVQSDELIKAGYKFEWTDLITKPVGEFLSRYFQGQGYKDGLHGLVVATLQGLSEFIVYLRVWEADKFKPRDLEITSVLSATKEASSDYNYWKADALLRESGGLKNRLKRKFKIS
ncbi:glycosyltransferase family 2 protein [Patescibacteria group bacterium]